MTAAGAWDKKAFWQVENLVSVGEKTFEFVSRAFDNNLNHDGLGAEVMAMDYSLLRKDRG
ncbi:hypothetical protein A2721_02875 [Candidatus Gottesmanbacteria bacterium RIFCSPHIGHO2_01_FULL_47_48]|uniref:Uncharacterized protein n=1 Tax=Candidatus Gottesmanbacteria bacterium RIFCSPHIGHO2_01_FULL_47_48 TaxID=1798381 RepID=A0A1F6A4L2_9BACT|nr:MAG: hypothetical protein A2721_02875 [Candidatus Gottesmanbacteria bacterium RIFCSPHIGHO2_01_FULL_47_48]